MVLICRNIVHSFLNGFNFKLSIVLLLFFIGISLTTNINAKPRYNKAHTYYNDPNILMYSQPIEVGIKCKLQAVENFITKNNPVDSDSDYLVMKEVIVYIFMNSIL